MPSKKESKKGGRGVVDKKTATLKTEKTGKTEKKAEALKAKVKVKDEKKEKKAATLKTEVSQEAEKKSEKVEKKKEVKPKITFKGTPKTMEELLAATGYTLKAPKRGDVVEGLITEINKRMVLIDIGAKTEGMVVDKEYDATKDLIEGLTVGDEVSVYVISPENDRGQILLSLKRAAVDRKWEQMAEYLGTGKVADVEGLEVNRGGLIVQTEGMRGFVPSSQFGKVYLGKMDELVGRRFKVKVIEVDREKNRLIFSERLVSEAEAIEKKDRALEVIKQGDTYEGVVSGIMPFGAFMTVTVPLKNGEEGQVEGLVHISEISWEKVNDPNDYFKQGDRVKVRVLGVDNGKLNLSVKQLKDDPWSQIAKKYPEGKQVKGHVTRTAPFGVFVTLEPGVDGLIHISKIPAGSEPKVGDELEVVVDTVEPDNRRMSLGMVLTEVPVSYR